MNHVLRIALALCLCFTVPSCGLVSKGIRKLPWKKKKKDAPKEDVVQAVGVVEMVNPDQKYVLVRTRGRMLVNPGTELFAMDGTGGQSKLKVSPEKKQDFLIADVVSGTPHIGNVVLFKPDKSAVPPATPPNQPVVSPNSPPPPDLPVQPPPIAPVNPNEFTRPQNFSPAPAPMPAQTSPIPQQPLPGQPGSETIPVPGQVQLPPVVR